MLAYVFWHRPEATADVAAYENAQRSFHAAIEVPSTCFRVERLPFAEGGGYEDWYLIEGWAALGELNGHAVDAVREELHARAASHAAAAWGALYEAVRGEGAIPDGVEWLDKPRGEPSAAFIASLPHESVWRRQLVLGPAPEFCGTVASSANRARLT
jgi:hypothetical protein